MKNDFKLPKNWHCVITENNKQILSKWRFGENSMFGLETYIDGYVGMVLWNTGRLEKGHNKDLGDKNLVSLGYFYGEEITFEQFKKYVLNEDITIEPEDYSYLIRLLKKLEII